MRFELYKNVCANCRHEFSTLNLPGTLLSTVYAVTSEQEVITVDPDHSHVWQTIRSLCQHLLIQHDIDQNLEETIIEALINHAFDYSPEGLRYYLWGRIPCPRCQFAKRLFIGPWQPPKFLERPAHAAHFETWLGLPDAEQARIASHIALQIYRRHCAQRV